MTENFDLKFSNYFKLPNPGLRAYFQHVVSGNNDEYRTMFYRGKSLKWILDEWNKTLVQIQDKYPDLYNFEIDLGEKVGPMSIMKPLSERMSDIDAYYDLISLDQVPISEEAKLAAFKEWSDLNRIRMKGQISTVEAMKKSTNSGSPFFTKRSRVVNDTLFVNVEHPNIQEIGLSSPKLSAKDGETWGACATLGWRGQEGGPSVDDVKQRVVWMFPFAVNIAELTVYQQLIKAMQHDGLSPHVPAWVSMEAVDREITKMFDTKPSSDLVICTDFSKFDQHFNPVMQKCAEDCLRQLFGQGPQMEYWLNNVFPIKYDIPLAYDYGKIRTGKHGMASGSGGTNADETLVHRCMQHEAAISHGSILNPHSQCLGDDGVLTYPGITVEDVIRSYCSHGQEMNPDKQYVSTHDCVYLRRWHDKDYRVDNVCVGVYSTNRALGRLAEQERFYDPLHWGKEQVALRQLAILENIKFHPLKELFVDFCMKGDKYRLGLDIPGFFDNIERIAEKSTDDMPDFLGYTRSLENNGNPTSSGISNWWIVKYLKSKA